MMDLENNMPKALKNFYTQLQNDWRIKNTIIPHREGSGGGAEDGGGGRDEQEEEEEDLLADWCWCAAPT